jgi:hypothetical protein
MNKKSFTLVEVLISIVLLSIIVIFLYQTLDMNEKSNKFFHLKLSIKKNKIKIKKLIFYDIIYSKTVEISEDKNNNTILKLYTTNTYHNSFFLNTAYLLSKENNLLRIESKRVFNSKKIDDDFFEYAYIDNIASNVLQFKIIQRDKKEYSIYMKFKDGSDMMFTFKSIRR